MNNAHTLALRASVCLPKPFPLLVFPNGAPKHGLAASFVDVGKWIIAVRGFIKKAGRGD